MADPTAFNHIAQAAHKASRDAGWYTNFDGTEKVRNVPEIPKPWKAIARACPTTSYYTGK